VAVGVLHWNQKQKRQHDDQQQDRNEQTIFSEDRASEKVEVSYERVAASLEKEHDGKKRPQPVQTAKVPGAPEIINKIGPHTPNP
jgi:hypothetical protein